MKFLSLYDYSKLIGLYSSIDDLPFALAHFALFIRESTGVTVSCFCAGPDLSMNWEVNSLS